MGRYNTFCEVDGREADVLVDADWWPAEPDVGAAAGYEINAVVEEEECIMHLMSEDELEQLSLRIGEMMNDSAADYGDYLYEQKKDRELDER